MEEDTLYIDKNNVDEMLAHAKSMVFVSRSNCMEMISQQFPDFKNLDSASFEEGMSHFANYYGNKIILSFTQIPPTNIMAEVDAFMKYLIMHGDQDVQEVIQTKFFEHELTIESETKQLLDDAISNENEILVSRSNCMQIIREQYPDFECLEDASLEEGMTKFANYYGNNAIKLFCQDRQSNFLNEVKDFMNALYASSDQDVQEVIQTKFFEHDLDVEPKIKEHIKLALESDSEEL